MFNPKCHISPEAQPTPTPPPPIRHSNPSLLPLGALSLLLGEPGTGKSLLALDLAARLSRGQPLPFSSLSSGHRPLPTPPSSPITSLTLSLEDSPATLQSRLLAAKASLYHALTFSEPLDLVPPNDHLPQSWLHLEDRLATPPSLIAKLNDFLLTAQNFRLLILDPLPAFLGSFDCSHQASIRRLLRPLINLAEQHHFAILGLTHLSKSPKKDLLHRTLGSIAYAALARSILLLTYDDQLGLPDRRLLIPIKRNFAKKAHAYAFTIQDSPSDLSTQDSDLDPAANLQWEDTPIKHHPLLAQSTAVTDSNEPDHFQSSRRELAATFLATMLAHGPMPSSELQKQARSLGISQHTLERARHDLHLNIYHNGQTGKWHLALPTLTAL